MFFYVYYIITEILFSYSWGLVYRCELIAEYVFLTLFNNSFNEVSLFAGLSLEGLRSLNLIHHILLGFLESTVFIFQKISKICI